MQETQYLVIGGGIAGLTFALEVAESGPVTVLFKKGLSESSTAWAQGGIAAVTEDDDSFESHIQDTLVAGAGLCDEKIVEIVVREGPECVERLIERGAAFDLDPEGGRYHLHREGGHSQRRIFHAADSTGWEIQRALLGAAKSHPNITFQPYSHAVDLITSHKYGISTDEPNRVLGVYVLNREGFVNPILAQTVLIATGGVGKIYLYTSNPDVASGDGIAMCYRAGVSVANMEFMQFHPTCLYHPKAKNFLLTEALRGEGAKLLRVDGHRFMPDYHKDAELAPRDVVARAIDFEIKKHGDDYALLDISHRESDFLKEHFPTLLSKCSEFGYDMTKEGIPVVPAAHYCCGGVVTDEMGRTTIEGLYVAGESAHTGLHGANRLASNSLLEGMVFATRAASDARTRPSREALSQEPPPWDPGSAVDSDEQVVITQNWEEIRRLMWNYVGIVRSNNRLQRALSRIQLIKQEIDEYYWDFKITPDLLELRNLCLVAELTVRCAMARKESRGLHYTIDYPECSQSPQDTLVSP